jgi:hypothetical protein
MARRLYKTTADYLAIAVTPALIMALVTSLVFFLLLVFYQGEWQGRLQYIMFLFVFAAVLIARIAIEEGRERAMLFSIALGVATAFVVSHFSDLSMALNLALLGLIWWCADRLTWDCTVIDEHENASGEGLLQTVGLDRPSAEPQAAKAAADVEPLGVTSREHPVEEKTWWRRAWEHFHKPRSPGVWVVYFSLAALPIFGFGQKFVSGAERETAFRYLFIYVASALALLLATCFLGLRRYLRQRRVEMPDKMAVVWVATGCTLIGALLIVCTILPRRNPVLEIAENAPPISFGSPGDLKPSRLGWGEEGIKDDSQSGNAEKTALDNGDDESSKPQERDSASGHGESSDAGQQQNSGKQQGIDSQQGDPSQQQGGSQGERSQSGQPGSQEQQGQSSQGGRQSNQGGQNSQGRDSPGNQSQGESRKQQGQGEPSQSGSQSQSQGSQGQSSKPQSEQSPDNSSQKKEGGQQQRDASKQQQSPQTSSHSESSSSREASNEQSPPQSQPESAPQKAAPPRQSFNPGSLLTSLFGWLGTFLRLAFYVVLVLVGIWLFRKYKDDLLAGFRELWSDLRRLWERLLGKKPLESPAAPAPQETGPVYRPFSDYPDPFASAAAGRYTPEQLVKYSFQALEAWARERGCPRHPEQTPHEFAQEIGARSAAVSRPARALAELYSRLAYAPGALPPSSVEHIKQLWTALRSG